MSAARIRNLVALAAGMLFGVGLVVGGMTLPTKVVGFLDFTGSWDPTLMFVMGGAVMVHAAVYRLVLKRRSPFFADAFQLPTRKDLDARLIAGAAIFGLGWGLGGYCPGPAVTSLVSGRLEVVAFVIAMVGSIGATGLLDGRRARARAEAT